MGQGVFIAVGIPRKGPFNRVDLLGIGTHNACVAVLAGAGLLAEFKGPKHLAPRQVRGVIIHVVPSMISWPTMLRGDSF